MGDIYCAGCGEPWDADGVRHGDMDEGESERFLNGEGCPACRFGQIGILASRIKNRQKFMESAIDSTDDPDSMLLRWFSNRQMVR